MTSELYRNPLYYEIAFCHRDLEHEVAVMEEAIARFSTIPVRRVLEVACGNSPHMPLFLEKGYAYTGIDLSREMLAFARAKAKAYGAHAELLEADLTDFTLPEPVDFAYVMLNSIYVTSTQALQAHYASVARALRPGGLYFLDWCVDFDPIIESAIGWENERDGVRVRTSYWTRNVNIVEQVYEENVLLEIDDHGQESKIEERALKRSMYPQEFLLFVQQQPHFEFIGWWNEWDYAQPLDGGDTINRPIQVLRRTA